jgi:hypothetical protein
MRCFPLKPFLRAGANVALADVCIYVCMYLCMYIGPEARMCVFLVRPFLKRARMHASIRVRKYEFCVLVGTDVYTTAPAVCVCKSTCMKYEFCVLISTDVYISP